VNDDYGSASRGSALIDTVVSTIKGREAKRAHGGAELLVPLLIRLL
jgi:hypothetical protein